MSENDWEKTELAVVKRATFGLDDRTYTTPILTITCQLLYGEVCLVLEGEVMGEALKVWVCTDIRNLTGRSCEVHVTGPGSSPVHFVRAKA